MNAMSPMPAAPVSLPSPGDAAACWRGRYIEEFAMAEAAVSEALATLSASAPSGAKSLLPPPMGLRFDALRSVVTGGGELAAIGGRVARALDDLRDHQHRRNVLYHGSSELSFDRSGDWTLTLALTSFRAGTIERSVLRITALDAALLLDDLRAARLRLDGQLCGLLASLRPLSASAPAPAPNSRRTHGPTCARTSQPRHI